MGFLRREPARTRIEPTLRPAETRAAPDYSVFGPTVTKSGQPVGPRFAENLATVTACVGAISSTMASLQPLVYRRGAEGRIEVPDHPVARLLRQPNAAQNWPDWMECMQAQALLYGNALSRIEHDGAGQVTALRPIQWPSVRTVQLPSGRLAYDVETGRGPAVRYLDSEVFHLRDRSDDGLVGRSRISRAPDVLGNAQALQDYNGHMWANQATPAGLVGLPPGITPAGKQRLEAFMEAKYAGVANARRIMFVDKETSWTPLSISAEDAEVLASRRFTTEELCRLFQVPPPIVQSYEFNSFTNAAQASLWFAQLTLAPWARKIEAEFGRSVFGPSSPYSLEIDLSGLMRGDFVARWQAWKIAVDSKILDPNEIREAEGYNPRKAQPAPDQLGSV